MIIARMKIGVHGRSNSAVQALPPKNEQMEVRSRQDMSGAGEVVPRRRLNRRGQHRTLNPIVDPGSHTGQHLTPQRLQDGVNSERQHDDGREHHERVEALARQDMIVDVEEIQRDCKSQDIDEETEGENAQQ